MSGFYESANSEGLESRNSILVRRIEMGTLSLKKLAVCDVTFVRDRERLICTSPYLIKNPVGNMRQITGQVELFGIS